MAESKHLFVLAKSMKHWPGVCVAGREVRGDGRRYRIGGWIRPVSSRKAGELYPPDIELTSGDEPEVFDFIEISLERSTSDPLQPENWLIASGSKWRRVNELYKQPRLPAIVETPQSVWRQREDRTDRVADDFLRQHPPKASLYWLHVPCVTAHFEWEHREGRARKRYRAAFAYHGVEYKLNITDPKFMAQHAEKFPAENHPARSFVVKPTGGCYLCVSLTPEFNGHHYKVAATIIEA